MTENNVALEIEKYREQAQDTHRKVTQFIEFSKTDAFHAVLGRHLETENLVMSLAAARTEEDRQNISIILGHVGFIKGILANAEEVQKNCEDVIKSSDEELERMFDAGDK